MSMEKVKVRFPPSPTGYCHVGTARMAVLNYIFAKKYGGTIVFRSEDTDKERSTREFEDDIVEQLHWMGLSWDEFYRTTELVEHHKKAMQRIVDEGKAYISEEESKKEEGKKVQVVRLRNPGTVVTFTDEIRGEITFDTTELGDFVIGRAIDDPLYQFAVVEDDGRMGITHVIRGEDHISNTPRQILIQEALGYPRPVYAHYPLLLGSDKSKLSKRTGDVAVRTYREQGFLPEALLNYIAVLGWTPPSGREVLSLEEMIGEFELTDLHKSGAVFDLEKLRWFNRQYLVKLPESVFMKQMSAAVKDSLSKRGIEGTDDTIAMLAPMIKERVAVWQDLYDMAEHGELDMFFETPPSPTVTTLSNRNLQAFTDPKFAERLAHCISILEALPESQFTSDGVKNALWSYAEQEGKKFVLAPIRIILSGREESPDPFSIAHIIGKAETLKRLTAALTHWKAV